MNSNIELWSDIDSKPLNDKKDILLFQSELIIKEPKIKTKKL